MTGIKCFQDGPDRYVIVLEGLSETPNGTKVVETLLSSMLGTFAKETDADAKPVPVAEEKIELKLDGKYEGKTPAEILNTKSNKAQAEAIKYLIDRWTKGNPGSFENDQIEKAFREFFVWRFKDVDPKAYTEKLTDKQKVTFTSMYAEAMFVLGLKPSTVEELITMAKDL